MLTLYIFVCCYWPVVLGDSTCNETYVKSVDVTGVTKLQSYMYGNYNLQTLMTLTDGKNCNVVSLTGLLRVYAVKFAIKKINADQTILPNIVLGYEFNDGCRSLPITMARGIDIARAFRENVCSKSVLCYEKKGNKGENVAVIGADYSYLSLPLASLLGLHSIPQISPVSSSPLLSSPIEYGSFYRTIPSDINIINVFIDILKFMNWTYVFAIGSSDDYGEWAISELKNKGSRYNICITEEMYISRDTSDTKTEAENIVKQMQKEKKAVVVIMFNYAKGMADVILREAERKKLKRFWLSSEGWNPDIIRTDVPDNQLASVLTISLDQGDIPELNSYIKNSIEKADVCDKWLRMLMKSKYHCNITNDVRRNSIKECAGYESLVKEIEKQHPRQMNNLVDAVYAIAHSLHNVTSRCSQSGINKCIYVNVEDLNNAMKQVRFKSLRNRYVSFDECGDIESISYSIESLQQNANKEWRYEIVGKWLKTRKQKLNLDVTKIKWPHWSEKTMQSECSPPCYPGQYITGKRGCCWECRECHEDTASNISNAMTCKECPTGFHTLNRKTCEKTQIVYLSYDSAIGVLVIVLSALGITLTTLVACGFFIMRNKDVSKEARPSFNYIVFPMLYALFIYSPLYLIKPDHIICMVIPIYDVTILTQYTSLLFIQNNSVKETILKEKSNHEKLRWLTSTSLYLVLLSVEILILIPWQITSKGYSDQNKISTAEIFLDCKSEYTALRILAIGYPYGLLILSTVISFSNRYDVDHFEKPKFLSYTCIASSILTVTDTLAVTIAIREYKAILKSLTMNCFGFIYISIMLMPKLYNLFKKGERIVTSVVNKGFIKDEIDRTVIVAQRRDRNVVISTSFIEEEPSDDIASEEIIDTGPDKIQEESKKSSIKTKSQKKKKESRSQKSKDKYEVQPKEGKVVTIEGNERDQNTRL